MRENFAHRGIGRLGIWNRFSRTGNHRGPPARRAVPPSDGSGRRPREGKGLFRPTGGKPRVNSGRRLFWKPSFRVSSGPSNDFAVIGQAGPRHAVGKSWAISNHNTSALLELVM